MSEPKHSEREAFELQYASGDYASDAISLARRQDGEYEQALARLCFKWFCKGRKAKPFDFVSALREAKTIVQSNALFKKFIDGTPLHNDIAVWMAEFAGQYSGQASRASKPEGVDETVEMVKFAKWCVDNGYDDDHQHADAIRVDMYKVWLGRASLAYPAPQDVIVKGKCYDCGSDPDALCLACRSISTKPVEVGKLVEYLCCNTNLFSNDIEEAAQAILARYHVVEPQQATGGGDE